MSPRARRFFGCLLPVVFALGGCGVCAMVVYASQIFVVREVVGRADMTPSLQPGWTVIVDNTAFWARSPLLGEIVWVDAPEGRLFRRIVGLPGDAVEVRGGQVVRNGEPLIEPYTRGAGSNAGPITLGANEFYVLADNREAADSRIWGPLERERIFGSASFYQADDVVGFRTVTHGSDVLPGRRRR